ncbi:MULTISPECIES: hypothetical protein [unclassified Variovorax]|uniref:hypothetical protein n=1 Tax=unclassified Variovorax TaxID=663243 RepID=UPI003F484DB4
MIFVFHLLDKPGSAALRTAARPQHKAGLAQVAERMAVAGPLLVLAFTNLWPQKVGFAPAA